MVDYEFGVLNWLLTFLHIGNYNHHDWFVNPWSGWSVITALVVWGAIPFVAIALRGLTQVPNTWRRRPWTVPPPGGPSST
jgi:N,N'-diacetylchitobiose transport system permease protein